MEMIFIDTTKITVRKGLERFRKDMGELNALVDSIKRTRQIVPIIITRDYELIAGGRRLAACTLLGIQVKVVFEDVTNDWEMRSLELEENLYRKDFTPAEQVTATQELHELKQRIHGESCSGKAGSGWTLDDTAKVLGKSRGAIIADMQLADMVKAFPELKGAKKKSEIKKAAKSLERVNDALGSLVKHQEAIKEKKDLFILQHKKAEEFLPSLEANSIDCFIADPPYGIEIYEILTGIGGKTGNELTAGGFQYDDSFPKALAFYQFLASELYRITTDKTHGYIFFGPEYYKEVREIFIKADFRVHVKPIIWIKNTTGQCNVPSAWPSSCYEMCLYIRKDNSRLVQEGKSDWLHIPPLNPSQKIHDAEKPVKLYKQLLERISFPGYKFLDPCCGSSSSLEAALELKMFAIGCEKNQAAYASSLNRLANLKVSNEKTLDN